MIAQQIASIGYPNFKESGRNCDRARDSMGVRGVMLDEQRRQFGPGSGGADGDEGE